MGYYDNVKDSIRDENSKEDSKDKEEASGSDSSGMNAGNFDTLREAAEETEVEDDEESGDDTPIEVLEEDGLKKEAPSNQRAQASTQSQAQKRSQQRTEEKQVQERNSNEGLNSSENVSQASQGKNTPQSVSGDTSDLEDKLDKIIEQNSRMIKILEGFGN